MRESLNWWKSLFTPIGKTCAASRRCRGRAVRATNGRCSAMELLEQRCVLSAFSVINTADSGPGSLRQAILDANAAGGLDTITFAIGSGAQTIQPSSALPTISGAVIIDGTTQPGYAGTPMIELSGSSAGAVNGLTITAGQSTVRGLVINRFGQNGIVLQGSSGNAIEGSYVGTNIAGTAILGNARGILILGSVQNRIGTNGDGVTDIRERNVIAGNLGEGILIRAQGAQKGSQNVIAGNYVGTDVTGTAALGNRHTGISIIEQGQANRIGTNGDGVADDVERNIIADSRFGGIGIVGDFSIVAGNYVGTDVTGTVALGNGTTGIDINGCGNRVGTNGDGRSDLLERNVVAGNRTDGVVIRGTENVVSGNYVGTDANGAIALGNGTGGTGHGVWIFEGQSNVVGTNGDGIGDMLERNIIAANRGDGVRIGPFLNVSVPGTAQNVVAGNFIGTDVTGSVALGNTQAGIQINGAAANRIGTNGDGVSDAFERNIIAANGGQGILIRSGGSQNVIAGNYVGTDVTGTVARGNQHAGISIMENGEANRIGTNGDGLSDEAERNIIAANQFDGVSIAGHRNVVTGNSIGTDALGSVALGNGGSGVGVIGQENVIGGDQVLANKIAFNAADGVAVVGATSNGNRIRGNAIYSNASLGIDLANDGITANDAGDADTGPNELQNRPLLTSAQGGTTTHVTGALNNLVVTTFTVDIYASTTADPSGFGEGQRHLGSVTVTTDGTGNANFNVFLPAATIPSDVITATATDPAGNTSEFSGAVATPLNQPPVADAGGPYFVTEEGNVQLDASGSTDPNQFSASLTYTWDLDGDNVFGETGPSAARGDETGITPTFSAAGLDGPDSLSIQLKVFDDGELESSASALVSIENVPPTAGIFGPTSAVRGQSVSFTFTATDVSAADQAGTFTYAIDWDGDGSANQTEMGAANLVLDHTYSDAGTYVVKVTATDKDGGTSALASHTIEIHIIEIQADVCCDSTKTVLVIGGTSSDDDIVFSPAGGSGDIIVNLNGVSLGTFHPTGRLLAFGQGGNDDIQVSSSVTLPAWLRGGDGDDRLKGGDGHDVLHGEGDDDLLVGGGGRDLLIGGTGADRIVGNADDDILITGTTIHDMVAAALCAIMSEWTSTRSYLDRTTNLESTLLKVDESATVFDDGAHDMVTGSAGQDWFFANLFLDNGDDAVTKDKITDLSASEFAQDLGFIGEA